MFLYLRIRFALLAAILAIAAYTTCAHADKITASLAQANKLLEQGLPVKAIELINQTLKSAKVQSDLAAKALLMRAQAQEKISKYAYALADYNQALWMQGLSAADKTQAEQGRKRIMAKLGVGDSGKKQKTKTAQAAQRKSASPPSPKREVSASSDGSSRPPANVQTSASEERTRGEGSDIEKFFYGLSGAAETPRPVGTRKAQPANDRVTKPADPKPAKATAQAIQTATVSEANTSSDSPAAGLGAPGSAPTGNFAVQFAALHSEKTALYEADRIAKRYNEWLGGRTPSIVIRPTSEGGTLYKVVVEPYERGEGTATCELLKAKGVSCMLISR